MKIFSGIITAIGTAALAAMLFAVGYFPCSAPLATEVFSQNTSNYEISPYTLDDLNALAVASRDYTVDDRAGTSTEEARTAFNHVVMNAANHSANRYLNVSKDDSSEVNQAKKEMWTNMMAALKDSRPNVAFAKEDVDDVAAKMAEVGPGFAFDADSFSHLDDCNDVINGLLPNIRIAGIIAAICLLALLVTRQWRGVARMFSIAPLILIVCFAFMGSWALVDFNSFFAGFHGVFFPQGNWTFPSDSLLICMYPTAFWMAMGALWLATTVVASIIVLAIGRPFARMADRKGQ